MTKLKDLTGQRFGRLLVLGRAENKNGRTAWLCRCDCGNEKNVSASDLLSGKTKSCGCIIKEFNEQRSTLKKVIEKIKIDPREAKRLQSIYKSMKVRCYNKNSKSYHNYGERGIKICDEWLGRDGLGNFIEWSVKNGYNNALTIDRTNNNGNYDPQNCRWVTRKEQDSNKRTNKLITYKGITKTITQWSNIMGLKQCAAISSRARKGLVGDDLLFGVLPKTRERNKKAVEEFINSRTHKN